MIVLQILFSIIVILIIFAVIYVNTSMVGEEHRFAKHQRQYSTIILVAFFIIINIPKLISLF